MKNYLSCLIILFLLCSCAGARSTSKSITKESDIVKEKEHLHEKESSIDTTKVVKSATSDENLKKSVVTEKTEQGTKITETFEPADSSKPSSYTDENGQKRELNNTKHTRTTETKTAQEKSKEDVSQDKKASSTESEQKGKSNTKEKDLAKEREAARLRLEQQKNTSRWSFSWWWILILLLVSACWLIWRRYKRLPPF